MTRCTSYPGCAIGSESDCTFSQTVRHDVRAGPSAPNRIVHPLKLAGPSALIRNVCHSRTSTERCVGSPGHSIRPKTRPSVSQNLHVMVSGPVLTVPSTPNQRVRPSEPARHGEKGSPGHAIPPESESSSAQTRNARSTSGPDLPKPDCLST